MAAMSNSEPVQDMVEARARHQELAEFSLAQAARYAAEGSYGRSFPHFLVAASLTKDTFREQQSEQFLRVTHALTERLARAGKRGKVEEVYLQAIDCLRHPELLTNFGSFLFLAGQTQRAEELFREALVEEPLFLLARDRLENLASSLLPRWHFPMLNDRRRNLAYSTALAHHLGGEGGGVVVDVGAGTGILSLLAVRAGADRVYACEASEVMVITMREVLLCNPEGSKVRLLPKLSLDLDTEDIAEKVDLLVTETFDGGLLGEHVLESLAHAWQTFLTPGHSRVVPARASFLVAPVQCPAVSRSQSLQPSSLGYLATPSLLLTSSSTEPYTTERLAQLPGGYSLLAPPQTLFTVDFEDPEDIASLISGEVFSLSFPITSPGSLDCLAGWFCLQLCEGVSLATGPGEGGQNCWEQAVFPPPGTGRVQEVRGGDIVEAEFLVRKHVMLQHLGVSRPQQPTANGGAAEGGEVAAPLPAAPLRRQRLSVPPSSLLHLSDPPSVCLAQWLAYRLASSGHSSRLLHSCPSQPPLALLQALHLSPGAQLTLAVDPAQSGQGRQMLDLVTALAGLNRLPVSAIDCISSEPAPGSGYSTALVAPVLPSGRLDQGVLLSLSGLQASLAPGGLLLPHSLDLWVQAVHSDQLLAQSCLTSDQPVLGLKIADQVNILSVSHQQELCYSGLEQEQLTEPCLVRSLDLTCLELGRSEVTVRLPVTRAGGVTAIVYWWQLQYGWQLSLNTRDSGAFSQAAFICTQTQVEAGGELIVRCQTERGLLELSLA